MTGFVLVMVYIVDKVVGPLNYHLLLLSAWACGVSWWSGYHINRLRQGLGPVFAAHVISLCIQLTLSNANWVVIRAGLWLVSWPSLGW